MLLNSTSVVPYKMLRISKLADYALGIVVIMIKNPDLSLSTTKISSISGLTLPTVRKVLKLLTNSNILQSVRGAHGGYRFLRDVEKLSILDVVEAVDGSIALTDCISFKNGIGNNSQKCISSCILSSRWGHINQVIRDTLNNFKVVKLT